MSAKEEDYCFPLNGNRDDPSIHGMTNVVITYRKTLKAIKFLKQTRFAPVLERFKEYVIKSAEIKNAYQILVLLTAGNIDDMPQTKDLLVELSAHPCSVIIIGIG